MVTRRMTSQTRGVLKALLGEPGREWYGLELVKEAALPTGTLYPILARLEQMGWVESRWENPNEHVAEGRPRRRYYKLTDSGAQQADLALQRTSPSAQRDTQQLTVFRPGMAGEAG